MSNNEISKFIALIFRHKPESIGISLDEHGWSEKQKTVQRFASILCIKKELRHDTRRDN